MNIAKNIKKLNEEWGLMQKEVANAIGLHPSNYSKIEKSEREFGIEDIDKLVHPNSKQVKVEDKTANEKVKLTSQLDEEDKSAVYRIIKGILTKNKFQTFFEQNIQTAK